MKPDYCIYKGKIGIYILTGKILLSYQAGSWSTFRDITQIPWVMIDLAEADRIYEFELLILTGISIDELNRKIKEAQDEG